VATLKATLRCPQCGAGSVETMPTDACLYFWECPNCHVMVKPKPGDCCVFCSYGTALCPPRVSAMREKPGDKPGEHSRNQTRL
jgi:hypothetical protein